MAEEDEPKVNRPPNDDFRQQRLSAWEPNMTPMKVIILLVAIGISFIPAGTSIIDAANDMYQSRIKYGGDDAVINCAIGNTCTLTFTFSENVDGPIDVYYELENFYQNHRKYVNSIDYYQMGGDNLGKSTLEESCISDVTTDDNDNMILNPCGLIANSFFTDIISLTTPTSFLDESGISWASDKDLYKQPEGFAYCETLSPGCATTQLPCLTTCNTWVDSDGVSYTYYYPNDANTQYLYETYPDQISPLDGVTDEHFMVWMRTAALPTFRKLYGTIDGNFNKGDTLVFSVQNNYEVDSFSGSKSLLLSSQGEFGARNPSLGVAYVVIGSICLFVAAIFAGKQLIAPRALADPTTMVW